jgi:hypothetical protein
VLAGDRPFGALSARQETRGGRQSETRELVVACHDHNWPSEADMAEGNPTRALECGESVQTPPVLYLQGTADGAHPHRAFMLVFAA